MLMFFILFFIALNRSFFMRSVSAASDFAQSKPCDENDEEEEVQEHPFVDAWEPIPEFVVQADDDNEGDDGDAEGSEECFSFCECEVDADDEERPGEEP